MSNASQEFASASEAAPADPQRFGILAALSVATLLIHGYHPYAEDGGIYVTGIKLFLHPALYPHDRSFVTARRAYSLFDPILGDIVRATHLSLEAVLLAAHLLCIFVTLLAAERLAARCFRQAHAPMYAAALIAAAFTLPVAGTSLFFMEPYLTARSFSTPLSLLAISFFLDDEVHARRKTSHLKGFALLLCATAFHLAMAAYTAVFIIVLLTGRVRAIRQRTIARTALFAAAILACFAIQAHARPETTAAIAAAHTRTYWYLSQWQWYEWLGLACPLIAFLLALRYSTALLTPGGRLLLRSSILAGCVACLLALAFARYNLDPPAVARLQPLRAFHNLYGVLIVLLGGLLAAWSAKLGRSLSSLPALLVVIVAGGMFFAQRQSFPASGHIEWPHRPLANPYGQAFLWARDNTPANALFALDSHYITGPGEDAQNFRAIAERSMLSDYSKDGGVAAIRPALADAWQRGSTSSNGLDKLNASDRTARLRSLGVRWVVLPSSATTPGPCPYDSRTIKVCPLN